MRSLRWPAVALLAAATLLLFAGCATRADLNALRSEVAVSQATARVAKQAAAAAAADARTAETHKAAERTRAAAQAAEEAAAAGDVKIGQFTPLQSLSGKCRLKSAQGCVGELDRPPLSFQFIMRQGK